MNIKNNIKNYLSKIKISEKKFLEFTKNKIIVFLFHEISNFPSNYQQNVDISVELKNFQFQIDYIKNNFEIIDPKKINNNNLSERSAIITFDDGFYGSMINAIPILEKSKIHSIHFLNSDTIDGKISFSGLINFLKIYKKYSTIIKKKNINIFNINHTFEYNDKFDKIFEEKDLILIKKFIGKFINYKELLNLTKKYKYFYIGNHLSNHYIASKLSNHDLSKSFKKNENYFKNCKNYLNYFSYPFGQKNIHYNKKTSKFLLDNHTNLIFSANPLNYSFNSKFLHRVPMFNSINDDYKIRNHILMSYLKEKIKIKNYYG